MLNTFFLQQTGLGIGTVKNGIVLIIPSILQDIPHDAIGLLVSLLILMEDNRNTFTVSCPQCFVLTTLIVTDNRVSCVKDMTCRTIVLLQLDHLCSRESTLKIQDIADVRTPELINRLIIVAHHAEVLIFSCQQLNEAELGRICILVLIYHNVLKPLLIILQHIGIGTEQINRLKDQIIEIQCIVLF